VATSTTQISGLPISVNSFAYHLIWSLNWLQGRSITECAAATIVSSPLGLVPKHDGGQRRVHDLSYPRGKSVNDDIPAEYGAIEYVTLHTILARVRQAGY
jgi:hypothetical protein